MDHLEPLCDDIISELSVIAFKKEDTIMADVTVQFLDQQTNAVQVSQYRLALEYNDNWRNCRADIVMGGAWC